jgi:hypothetical protein
MRFRALSLLAGVTVLALTAGGVLAAVDQRDQHQDSASQWWDAGDYGTAQTFTAAVSGHLDRISLWGSDTSGTITGIDLREGGPTGTVLGTSSSASPVNGAWFDADFSPTVQVTAGSMYAIVLHTSGGVGLGGTCDAGAYTRGEAWGSTDLVVWQTIPDVTGHDVCITDLAFQEWVIPSAIAAPPTVAMAFGAASIPVGGTTSLTFTITNPNAVPTVDVRPAGFFTGTLTNISFTDTLPAGLLIATPNNLGGSCGGVITATAATNLVSITGLTLAGGATCGFGVDVIGVAPGTQANTTGAITSTESDPGLTATASITVTALSTPAPIPTPTPAPTLAPAPTPTPTPRSSATPPPTGTSDRGGPGGESPLLPLLVLTAVAALAATTFVLRSDSRVHHR